MKLSAKRLAAAPTCLLVGASLLLGACHVHVPGLGHKAPTGQVVATVEGQEITLRELDAELAGVNVTDPKQRKTLQDLALQSIIARKALAKAARDQGIEKSADFALQRDRTEEQLLAQFLQRNTAAAVPAPTPEEASRFVMDNPQLFAERKIFVVDQIRAQRPADPAVLKQLEPLKTLDEIADFFTRAHIAFVRGVAELDADALGPQITDAVLKLKPEEVFILPEQNILLVNHIRETKVQPVTGQAATDGALAYLKQQRTREAVGRTLNGIVKTAAETVTYNPTYAPQKKPAPPAAGANATAPAATSPAPAPGK
jgi:EpsD family peptidyl-prolyl cis-trans isomerase